MLFLKKQIGHKRRPVLQQPCKKVRHYNLQSQQKLKLLCFFKNENSCNKADNFEAYRTFLCFELFVKISAGNGSKHLARHPTNLTPRCLISLTPKCLTRLKLGVNLSLKNIIFYSKNAILKQKFGCNVSRSLACIIAADDTGFYEIIPLLIIPEAFKKGGKYNFCSLR